MPYWPRVTPRADAALFAELLSLPNDDRYPRIELTPQQRRQRTLDALINQIVALAEQSPILMIVEDIHWIDPTTLEVLGRGIDRIKSVGVLLIITYRPEFAPPWISRPYVTALTLNRLGEREIASMIDRVRGDSALPDSIRQDIIERTDGIPLFVEEMTKAVLEAESEGAAQQTAAAVPASALAVPASLHASLLARLDRLGPGKEVAQIGAAIGREFSHALLAAVIAKPEAELHAALDRLISAGLLFRQGLAPHASYLFKHALVQEAAYGTLLRESRRALHARIVETIERDFSEVVENQPELLARHCTVARLLEKAAALWGKAGLRSLARSALLEAIEQLTRALTQLAALPPTAALRREEIRLQVALITPLIHVKGYAASEVKTASERAHVLIEQAQATGEPPEDPLLLFSVLYSFWVANLIAFKGNVCRNFASQILSLAERQKSPVPLMIGHRVMGATLLSTGEFVESLSHLDRAYAFYNPAERFVLTTRFGADPLVTVLSFRSWAKWFLGYPAAALADAQRALEEARDAGQAATLMFALTCIAWTFRLCARYAEAAPLLAEAVTLADQKGAQYWKSVGTTLQGDLSLLGGNASDAVQKMSVGITAMRATGATSYIPGHLSSLAWAYANLGRFDDAETCIDQALTLVETTKEMMFEADIVRMTGELALKTAASDPVKAEACFARAIAISRQQQAKSFELRAAMSLARLWRDQGKPQQGRELLAPVYGWFTEGFDTRDLQEAKKLLDELHA
jgi:predicted ATPase